MPGTYNIQQNSQGHVKDNDGQIIDGLCVWCYRITYDPGAPPPDTAALEGDWRFEGLDKVLDPSGPELTDPDVDSKTVPDYQLDGKKVVFSQPKIHPDATDKKQ